MVVKATYFQNSKEQPLVYGDVELGNSPRESCGDTPKSRVFWQRAFWWASVERTMS